MPQLIKTSPPNLHIIKQKVTTPHKLSQKKVPPLTQFHYYYLQPPNNHHSCQIKTFRVVLRSRSITTANPVGIFCLTLTENKANYSAHKATV